MSDDARSFDPSYFDRLYREKPDPWDFTTSDYEARKYAATLEALGGRRFHSAFEVGCSIGILTRQLAPKCDSLLAIDVAQAAVAKAQANCTALPQVTIQRMRIPQEWPDRKFDLILLSEVLYFLCLDDIAATADHSIASLESGGAVLLVHWTGETDYPCGGNAAVEHYLTRCGRQLISKAHRQKPEYRLDLLARA
jgi:predicted TPR repeat methyltransferase